MTDYVNLVDDRNYFIKFLIFTEPPLGGAVKAVFLPHLHILITFSIFHF